MTFEKLNLSPELLQSIKRLGYTQPTPIQAKTIPTILMGRDVLACAQTGTGKTASFLLPVIDILIHDRSRAGMPRCIILTPTRELAIQISDIFSDLASFSLLKHVVLVGGSSPVIQEKALACGPDVLIATPGRLLDMHEKGKILFLDVKLLVLDESDRMLDMGFMPDIERLLTFLPQKRQSLLFSATMPVEIKKLADKMLNSPAEVSITPDTKTASTIQQIAIQTATADKKNTLKKLLQENKITQTIIFCNQKKSVAELAQFLQENAFNVSEIHGNLSQHKRNEVLSDFKGGKTMILVASDVAARGLDVDGLSHVFNFDLPINHEDYVHRIGRTGRAGQAGTAISILGSQDKKLWEKIVKATQSQVLSYETGQIFEWQELGAVASKKVDKKPVKKESGTSPVSGRRAGAAKAAAVQSQKEVLVQSVAAQQSTDSDALVFSNVVVAPAVSEQKTSTAVPPRAVKKPASRGSQASAQSSTPRPAQAPTAQAPVIQAPAAQVPTAQAPVMQPPAAQVPTAQAPVIQVPTAQAPVTQGPARDPVGSMAQSQVASAKKPTFVSEVAGFGAHTPAFFNVHFSHHNIKT